MNATDARNKAVSSTWYLGAAQVFGTGATYLLLASLTSMGAEQYGLWVLVLLAVSYLSPWAGLGLGSGALALAAALIIAAETLATAWFGGPENTLLVWLIAVLFPLEAQLLIGYSYFQALERLGTYAALSAARHLLELVLLSVLIFVGAELWTLLVARAGSLAFLVAVQHFLVRGHRGAGGTVPAGELGRMLRFGFPMIPASFIWILVMGIDRFMLEHYGRLAEVGIYNVADVLAAFLLNATRPINGVLQPRFANLIEQSPEEIGRYIRRAGKYLALLLFPGAVGLTVAAQPLVDLVATPAFAPAAAILPLLAGAYALIGLSNPFYHLVFLRRGGRAFLGLYPLCLGINVGCNIVLIPGLGGTGAAWATLASFVVYVLGLLALSERKHVRAAAGQWPVLAVVLACSAGMGLAVYALRVAHPPLAGWALVPVGVVAYVLLVRLAGLVPADERATLLAPLAGVFTVLRERVRVNSGSGS